MRQHFSNPDSQHGVALLEVLIVFFVLSIGLLGMAALQLKSIQYSQSSYLRSQAVVAANDILDRVRLNGGDEIVGTELDEWVAFVSGTLPVTEVPELNCDAGVCTVTIIWDDRFAVDDDNDGENTQKLVISSGM